MWFDSPRFNLLSRVMVVSRQEREEDEVMPGAYLETGQEVGNMMCPKNEVSRLYTMTRFFHH